MCAVLIGAFIAGKINTRIGQDTCHPKCPQRISVTKKFINIHRQFKHSSVHYGTYDIRAASYDGSNLNTFHITC